MTGDLLTVRVDEHAAGAQVVTAAGEVDLGTAPALEKAILTALDDSPGRMLVVDLTGVTFLASVGLSALVRGHERAAERGVPMRLVVPGSSVPHRSLEIAGLLEILAVRPDLGAALAAE